MNNFYIVTRVMDGASFIHSTIVSVVTQAGDFTIHYHVHDAGSTDGTIEALRYWQSVLSARNPLTQCRAVHFSWDGNTDSRDPIDCNAYFSRFTVADDSLMAWCDARMSYLPHAFNTVAKAFADAPQAQLLWGGRNFFHGGMLVGPGGGLKRFCRGRESDFFSVPVFRKGALPRKDDYGMLAAARSFCSRFFWGTQHIHLDIPLGVLFSSLHGETGQRG